MAIAASTEGGVYVYDWRDAQAPREHALAQIQPLRFPDATLEGQHRMVRCEQDLVGPTGIHEVDQLRRQILRRIRRGHHVQVGLLEQQPHGPSGGLSQPFTSLCTG